MSIQDTLIDRSDTSIRAAIMCTYQAAGYLASAQNVVRDHPPKGTPEERFASRIALSESITELERAVQLVREQLYSFDNTRRVA